MQRRRFLRLALATAVAAPLASEAQPITRPRVGWLTSSVVHTANVEAFRQGMRTLGHPDIGLELRAAAGQMERLPMLAAELVALNVDVIVTDGGPAAVAAKQATATIPIVIGATAADLVQQGLVASLARPGGNVTGFTISTGAELYGKRLELLREALPALTRVAVVWNPRNEMNRSALPSIETAARTLGIQPEAIEARDAHDIDRAFGSVARPRVGAILMVADAFLWSQRDRIVALADRYRLPAIYPEVEFAEAGGLMAYGPNVRNNFRRAAGYVDRILKGARPADLPVEQPATFELVVNLKAAKALRLTLPRSLLLRADHVIE
jgi:putative ABC transport system substrate-binding protein